MLGFLSIVADIKFIKTYTSIIECLSTFNRLVCVLHFIMQMDSDMMGLNEFYYK